MGAAGAKNLQQSEKAKHAANVISAFEAYAADHGNGDGVDDFDQSMLGTPDPQRFKAQVLRAAAESKERRGVDVDSDLAVLDDQDLIQIGKWAQSNCKLPHSKGTVVPLPINNSSKSGASSHKRNLSERSAQSQSQSQSYDMGSPGSVNSVESTHSSPVLSPVSRSHPSHNNSQRYGRSGDRSYKRDLDSDGDSSVTSLRMTDFEVSNSLAAAGGGAGSGRTRGGHLSDMESDDGSQRRGAPRRGHAHGRNGKDGEHRGPAKRTHGQHRSPTGPVNPNAVRKRRHLVDDDSSGVGGHDSAREPDKAAAASGAFDEDGSDSDDRELRELIRGGAGKTGPRVVGSTTTASVMAAKKQQAIGHGSKGGPVAVHPSPQGSKLTAAGAAVVGGGRIGGSKVHPLRVVDDANSSDDLEQASDADAEEEGDDEDDEDEEDILRQMASHNTMYYSLTAKPAAAGGPGGGGGSNGNSPVKPGANIIHFGKSGVSGGGGARLNPGAVKVGTHANVNTAAMPADSQGMYASLAEQTDMRNEILMELQRQKMWSYAENAKLEEDCVMLQKQLEMMERLDKDMGVDGPGAHNRNHSGGLRDERNKENSREKETAAMHRINTGTSGGSTSSHSSHRHSRGAGGGESGPGLAHRDNTNYPHTTLLEQEEVYRSYSNSRARSRAKDKAHGSGAGAGVDAHSPIPVPGSRVGSALLQGSPSTSRKHTAGRKHRSGGSRGSVSSRDDSSRGSDRKFGDEKSYRDEKFTAAGLLHSSSKHMLSSAEPKGHGSATNLLGNVGTPPREGGWDRDRAVERDVSPIHVARSSSSQGSRSGVRTGGGTRAPTRPPSAPASPVPASGHPCADADSKDSRALGGVVATRTSPIQVVVAGEMTPSGYIASNSASFSPAPPPPAAAPAGSDSDSDRDADGDGECNSQVRPVAVAAANPEGHGNTFNGADDIDTYSDFKISGYGGAVSSDDDVRVKNQRKPVGGVSAPRGPRPSPAVAASGHSPSTHGSPDGTKAKQSQGKGGAVRSPLMRRVAGADDGEYDSPGATGMTKSGSKAQHESPQHQQQHGSPVPANYGRVRHSPVEGDRGRGRDRSGRASMDVSPAVGAGGGNQSMRSPQGNKAPGRAGRRTGAHSDVGDSDTALEISPKPTRRRGNEDDARNSNNSDDRPSRFQLQKQNHQSQSYKGERGHGQARDERDQDQDQDIFSDDNSVGRDRLSASDAEDKDSDALEVSSSSVGAQTTSSDAAPSRVEPSTISSRRRQGNAALKNANNRRKTFENDPVPANPYDISGAGGAVPINTSESRAPPRKAAKPLRRIPQPVKDKDKESDAEKDKVGGLDFGIRGKNFGGDNDVGAASGGGKGADSDTKSGGRVPRHGSNSNAASKRNASGHAGGATAAISKGGAAGGNGKERDKDRDDRQEMRQKDLLSQTLNVRWCEVELLLRRRIASDADIDNTLAAAEAGIEFMAQLNDLSKSTGLLRGTLSRWLLPYDSTTSITEQCSTPHSVMQNLPQGLRGKVSERQVRTLVTGANNVRQLVRIKIADDNDLDQAKKALITAIDFFKLIQVQATANDTTPFALLNDY